MLRCDSYERIHGQIQASGLLSEKAANNVPFKTRSRVSLPITAIRMVHSDEALVNNVLNENAHPLSDVGKLVNVPEGSIEQWEVP